MKVLRTTLCAVFLLLLATTVPALAADLKIGTINLQVIFQKSKAGAEARTVMEAKNTEFQSKFKGEQEALKAQADEIEKKGSAWSEEVKAGKERDHQKKMRELQLKYEDAKFEVKQLEKKVMEPLLKELQAIIDEISKNEGYTMIFERGSNGLVFASASLDISDKVIKALDAKTAK